MLSRRPSPAPGDRSGVVLLVVISLLVLFALVGLAFVVYAEGQANIARLWREGETTQAPGMDPDLLLSYFLGQLIYDTDNPHSALRGHSLARTMYGRRADHASLTTGVGVTPFNGLGRLQSKMTQAAIDYTNYGGAAPNNPDDDGGLNPPYTYPDLNNFFLGAVRAADGKVLIPSFVRAGLQPGQPLSLRPNQAYHGPTGFPPPDDPQNQCDVKNLADSPGFGSGPNDSIWIDCGFPVATGPDGRKFKPLFAPLIVDLDNRVNLNIHGNNFGRGFGNAGSTVCQSHQGWSVGEVNIAYVLTGPNFEARNLLDGTGTGPTRVEGRYDPGRGKWCSGGYWVEDRLAPAGHSYNMTNLDCNLFNSVKLVMPARGTGRIIPTCQGTYGNGWVRPGLDQQNHPMLFNFFDPTQNVYHKGGVLSPLADRRFHVRSMDAILRYRDAGSPALSSELFLLLPQSLAIDKNRRQVTTHSFDYSRPGVTPAAYAAGVTPYQLPPGSPYPQAQPQVFNPPAAAPNSGEFGPGWGAVSPLAASPLLRGRIDLNRGFPTDYPAIGANRQFAAADIGTRFKGATAERRQFTQEIFDRLRELTGAADLAAAVPGAPDYDALRWLAQLAVNITDFINYQNKNQTDCSDISTSFNWNPRFANDVNNGWVFGVNIPKLVINEAYIQADQGSAAGQPREVNCYVELHNPILPVASNEGNISFTEGGNARLFTGGAQGYAPYRLVVAHTRDPANPQNDNTLEMRKPSNVLGTPVNVQTVIDDFSKADPPKLTPSGAQTVSLSGDNLFIVKPPSGATGPAAGNTGYYVLGSHKAFPGTETAAQCFVTLPLKDDQERPSATRPEDFPGKPCSMRYAYAGQGPAPAHTLCLQRLACPYLPPQPDPAQEPALGYFNPYLTVDYMAEAPSYDNAGPAGDAKNSVGRNQPYAADKNHQIQQQGQEQGAQPKHTFFAMNTQFMQGGTPRRDAFAYDWLIFGNRPGTSQFDLLHVSGYKPSELTQMFVTGSPDPATGKPQPADRFRHRAPWFESTALIYRFLEYCEGGLRPQFTPPGGRFPGKVNINTVWDLEAFQAVCDARGINWFTPQGVQNVFQNLTRVRTPGGAPGAGDRPFRGFATAAAAPGGQYPTGSGIDDTLLRADPNNVDPQNFPDKRLLEPDPNMSKGELRTQANGDGDVLRPHPFCRYELLTKTGNVWTTRSNVFAVLLTVGFFEVIDDANPNTPPKLGREIGREQNRHQRHRMLAVIDRTNLTVAVDARGAAPQIVPGEPGQRPMFIPSLTAVPQPGPVTLQVPVTSGAYEEVRWSFKPNTKLLLDVGPSQEVVTVTNATANSITVTCAKPHAAGFAISTAPQAPAGMLALPGNPGPQPRFDVRSPAYDGIVRYFSVIE